MPESNKPSRSLFASVPPKFTFLFGIAIGVAVFSLFGYVSLLIRVSGNATGAPVQTNTAIKNDAGRVAGESDVQGDSNAEAPTRVTVSSIVDGDYVRGNPDAPYAIIEYSDLECPYCGSFHGTVKQALEKYPNDVKWVYRHFPLSFHANAKKLATGAECAGELGGSEAFWQFIDRIFEDAITADGLTALADELGISTVSFNSCLDSGKFDEKIAANLDDGASAGVTGTPTSFVVDAQGEVVQQLPGALPFSKVDSLISTILQQ